jgi:hypothetical protein
MMQNPGRHCVRPFTASELPDITRSWAHGLGCFIGDFKGILRDGCGGLYLKGFKQKSPNPWAWKGALVIYRLISRRWNIVNKITHAAADSTPFRCCAYCYLSDRQHSKWRINVPVTLSNCSEPKIHSPMISPPSKYGHSVLQCPISSTTTLIITSLYLSIAFLHNDSFC